MRMAGYSENAVGLDLSNKVVIKAALGEDIRKIPIQNEDITYDELLLMMQRIFKGKLSAADDVIIKYKDEDGDMITIADSSDLTFAVQCHRVLKITLYVNGQPRPIEAEELKHIKTELRNIRDNTTRLLDQIEPSVKTVAGNGVEASGGKSAENVAKASQTAKTQAIDASSQFDPLGQKYRPTVGKQETPERTMGGQHAYINSNESRPDTPSSASSKSYPPPSGQPGQHQAGLGEENVATIQPSVHQQVNAGHPTQAVLNGAPAPLPPQPPSHHQHQHQQQPQHGGPPPPPPASHMYQPVGPPPSSQTSPPDSALNPSAGQPPMLQQPGGGYAPPPAPGANQPPPQQQQPQSFMRGPAPPPPQPIPQQQAIPPQPPAPGQQQQFQHPQQHQPYSMSGYPPPPGSQQQPMFGQQPQGQMPPTSYPSAGGLPPPPSSTTAPGAPPVGPPPSFAGGAAAQGANPFARGGQFQSGPYVRPAFSTNY